MTSSPKPRFFATPADFRAWLEKHHTTKDELLVGFHKRGTKKASITWPESVDEALSFGWIDGVRRSLGAEAYSIRFTPRRAGSIWSLVNVRRVDALRKDGRMTPAGEKAFAARRADRTGVYSFEQSADARKNAELPGQMERALRAVPEAWADWEKRPPWYRRAASWLIVSAKREETRERRFAELLAASRAGRPIAPLDRRSPGQKKTER